MGVDTVLLCNTCKVALWSKHRVLFDFDARKKLSGRVGVRKIGRLVTLIEEIDKFQKRMEGRGIAEFYHFFDGDGLKKRLTEIKDFMLRHHKHDISVTGTFDDVPDPNSEWDRERGWKFEEDQK